MMARGSQIGRIRPDQDLDEQQTQAAILLDNFDESTSAPNSSASIDSTTGAGEQKREVVAEVDISPAAISEEVATVASGSDSPPRPEEIQDDSAACPVPFNSAIFEDDEGAKKRAAATAAASSPPPSSEEREDIIPHPTILEDDNVHPMPLHSMEEEDEGVKKRAAAAPLYTEEGEEEVGPTLLEVEDDGYHPVPFNSADFEDDEQVKRRAAAAMAPLSSPAVINYEMTATVNETSYTTSSPSLPPPPTSSNQREGERQSVDLAGDDNGNNRNSTRSLLTASAAAAIAGTVDEEHRNSTPMIEAFLVEDEEDGEVYDAVLAVPLWKQKKFRISLVCILASILALAISLGVYASNQTVTQVVVAASPPPSVSEPPSLSMIPSSSPSACAYKISTNKQVIDPIHPDAIDHIVAINGREMVVVSRDITGSTVTGESTGSVYIVFYSLTNNNEWERNAAFTEAVEWNPWFGLYSVGISGKIAAVGVPSKNEVQIFEQNSYGIWAKFDSLSSSGQCGGAGTTVSVDEDLLVFTDTRTCGYSTRPLRAVRDDPNAAYVFRRVGGKWIPVKTFQNEQYPFIEYTDTFVESNIIALQRKSNIIALQGTRSELYTFDRDNATLVHLQDLDSVIVGAMSEDHIVQSTKNGVTIYQRDPESGYIWHSNINITEHGVGFGRRLAIDKEVLVVGSDNYTHFFMQEDGNWESVLTLNKAYEAYQIFGRTVVAVDQSEVHAMNIDVCTAPEPTQSPTVSTAPSICHLVEVSLVSLNYYGIGVQWKIVIQRIESDLAIVGTWSGWGEQKEYLDGNSLCLPPGQYEISVRLESGTGVYKPVGAHYSVKSDGQTVVKTNFYDQVQRKDIFSLPLPSPKPSVSQPTSTDLTEMCFNTPNWKDHNGGCDWYERYDACRISYGNEWDMGRATEHCCYCGGGNIQPTAAPVPTPRPTNQIPPIALTPPPTFAVASGSSPPTFADTFGSTPSAF